MFGLPSKKKEEPVKKEEPKKEAKKEKPKSKPKKDLFDDDSDSDDLFGTKTKKKDPDDVIARKKSQLAAEGKLKIDPRKLLNKGPVTAKAIKKKEAKEPEPVMEDPLGADPLGGTPVKEVN